MNDRDDMPELTPAAPGATSPGQDSDALSAMAGQRAVRTLPEVRLYSTEARDAPETRRAEQVLESGGTRMVINVTDPTITPVLPPEGAATGTAVIIAPGGGYYALSIDAEGMRQARWLADRGIAAFVLKYRTKPVDPQTLEETLLPFLSQVVAPGSDVYELIDFKPAVDDGDAAVRLVRARATEWNIDPQRIVFMGFSAGAFTTLKLATAPDVAGRPNYVAPIYPSLEALPVPEDVPPMFGAIALDDELFGNRDFGLLTAWQASGRPFEFHLYERGGHGFGTGSPGTTTLGWIDAFYGWLGTHGLTARTP